MEAAFKENRILLTRDRPLARRAPPGRCVFIHHQRYAGQIKECMEVLGLSPDPKTIFTRCALCNAGLEAAQKEAVKDRVPPGVYERQEATWACRPCDKIYWKGTHFEKSPAILEESFRNKEDRRRF